MNSLLNKSLKQFSFSNITPSIQSKLNKKIYRDPQNPLCILKSKVTSFFESECDIPFRVYDDLPEVVSVKDCFDDLLVEPDHVSRLPSNTYYVSEDKVLRTHMTTCDVAFLKKKEKAFITVGDVYRRDTVDKTHYPVFHQVDGVRVFDKGEYNKEQVANHLKETLDGLVTFWFK